MEDPSFLSPGLADNNRNDIVGWTAVYFVRKGFSVGYVCDDDKVNPKAEFRKIGLKEIISTVDSFPIVFHLFIRKGAD